MYLQKVLNKKLEEEKIFFVADEKGMIRIRIRKSEVRIRGSGTVPKWHRSGIVLKRKPCLLILGLLVGEDDGLPVRLLEGRLQSLQLLLQPRQLVLVLTGTQAMSKYNKTSRGEKNESASGNVP
jgi:hypothetical protein